MKSFKKIVFGLAASFALAATAHATPVPFTLKSITLTGGTGYASDTVNDTQSKINATFTVNYNATTDFSLEQGGTKVFQKFGTMNLLETCLSMGNLCRPEGGNEVNQPQTLSVKATFSFINPFDTGTTIDVVATGAPTAGLVNDTDTDLYIDFTPQTVAFGNKGEFTITINDLDFKDKGPLDLNATIALTKAPESTTSPNEVPEPVSLSLMGLGLLGVGAVRRRKSA